MMSPSMNKNLKLASIPVLGLVLVYVIVRGRNSGDQASVDPAVNLVADAVPTRASTQALNKSLVQTSYEWPTFELEDLPNVDPFDRQALFPSPSVVENSSDPSNTLVGKSDRSSADALKPLKIQAVFQSPSGITALVENRVVHIGDRLDDGSEVVGITPEQLLLMKPAIH
jgi:hypothetical protein